MEKKAREKLREDKREIFVSNMAESHSGCEEINEKIIAVEDLSLILWNLVRG